MPVAREAHNRFMKVLLSFFENPDSPWHGLILMPDAAKEKVKSQAFCSEFLESGE